MTSVLSFIQCLNMSDFGESRALSVWPLIWSVNAVRPAPQANSRRQMISPPAGRFGRARMSLIVQLMPRRYRRVIPTAGRGGFQSQTPFERWSNSRRRRRSALMGAVLASRVGRPPNTCLCAPHTAYDIPDSSSQACKPVWTATAAGYAVRFPSPPGRPSPPVSSRPSFICSSPL